jgi:HAD superfamily hydrolase (TIGR01490 family)
LYILYKIGVHNAYRREKGAKTVMRKFTRLFRGMRRESVEEFFDRSADVIIGYLNSDVVEEIAKTKALGCHTVLLSGCFEHLLEAIGARLGIDIVIGTRINYEDDKVDIKRPLEVIYGNEKISRLRSSFQDSDIDWSGSYAYADSLSDVPVLELVGNPVAVNPDSELKAKAEKSGWRIIVSE